MPSVSALSTISRHSHNVFFIYNGTYSTVYVVAVFVILLHAHVMNQTLDLIINMYVQEIQMT